KGTDIFRYKFHGLFYVAPAQDAFMCRLRIPNGILNSYQMQGVADLAQRYGGGYAHVTTRANLQIREIAAADGIHVATGLQDLGLTSRGAGADNIRNVTGSPTAGIDPQELLDTRPLARELHHYILQHRELYGLPRKFNVAFDGGGRISVLEDTNDIGFAAVRVGEGKAAPPGVYLRMALGGITGHRDFARDTGVLLRPEECLAVAEAVIKVFIDHGDRTDRRKARMKYVLDRWGMDKYMEEVQKRLPFALRRLPLEDCEPRGPIDRYGHIGVHPQRQENRFYVGVVVPVGRLEAAQMRGLADIAEGHGSATLRLTVWQNLLISDIPGEGVEAVKAEIRALGLDWSAGNVRAGLVACTGNGGCRFAASDTKRHALAIADWLERRIDLDTPVNIHLTGCHHSCAQHYVGDVGLLACKVDVGEDAEPVEGYHVYLGGGFGDGRRIARELRRNVLADELPQYLESLLRVYLARRRDAGEGLGAFASRHPVEQLAAMMEEIAAPA
ncbi:MAG: NirA family protein, partial [Pseudomonadota bacterium]|nr:NirA family protein [Pseudomonadota bacterium]